MKNSKVILALWLGTFAWAQKPPQQQVAQALTAKPNAPQVSQPAAPVRKPPAVAQKPTAATAKAVKPAPAVSPKAVAKPSPTPKSRPAVQPTARKYVPRKRAGEQRIVRTASSGRSTRGGRRDPFVSPVVERSGNMPVCTGSGKKCLVVGELSLHGVVHSSNGYIAVVMNGDHTYFLRENDPLADGAVERITRDTLVLRERSSDALGRPLMRQVTKKLGASAF